MVTKNPQLDRLEKMLSLVDNTYVKPEELKMVFEAFTSIVKDFKDSLQKYVDSSLAVIDTRTTESSQLVLDNIKAIIKSLEGKVQKTISDFKKEDDKADVVLVKNITDQIKTVKDSIPKPTDLSPINSKIEEMKRLIASLNGSILSRDNFDVTRVKAFEQKIQKRLDNLDEELKKLGKIKEGKGGFQFVGSPGSGGKVVKVWDLSPFLDGVTATFKLPAFWRITSIVSSSQPTAFRPEVDFTVNYTDMSITFTSEISPASTLQTGQSIIVLYAET